MADEVYYHDYLHLDRLLSAQQPRSGIDGPEAHDEMLFIIVHQVYELCFKLILHELESILESFSQPAIRERGMGSLVARLERIHSVQRVMMDQLDVLETMTALDFLDFRELLVPASGFQSLQFRLIENRLGYDPAHRVPINEEHYTERFAPEHRELLNASEAAPSLYELVERWLERTPFLEVGDFAFWDEYRDAVNRMLARDRKAIDNTPALSAEQRQRRLEQVDALEASFTRVLDESHYEQMAAKGQRHMSRRAFMAALLINLYRDEPILQLPFRLLTDLVDIDEGFMAWRQRHALMVQRMIGQRMGTGGTSGQDYLRETISKARTWPELIELPTYLIPRSELPSLPPTVVDAMRSYVSDD